MCRRQPPTPGRGARDLAQAGCVQCPCRQVCKPCPPPAEGIGTVLASDGHNPAVERTGSGPPGHCVSTRSETWLNHRDNGLSLWGRRRERPWAPWAGWVWGPQACAPGIYFNKKVTKGQAGEELLVASRGLPPATLPPQAAQQPHRQVRLTENQAAAQAGPRGLCESFLT